jgi:SAM-dependent methyltransferase
VWRRTESGNMRLMRPDAAATDAIRDLYDDLEIDGRVLDLGGAGGEHFNVPPDELTAAGELTPLPFGDASFDDAVCFGRPEEPQLFAEVARVLRPRGRFVVTFSSQLAPDTAAEVRRLRRRFQDTPAFGPAESDLRTSLSGAGDQLWAVWARRS